MSINSYLENLSSKLVIKDSEKNSIKLSIETLQHRINIFFNDVEEHFYFGSYTRGTILPRKADSNSDIDYMIVFKNPNQYKPQTFLNNLRNFAKKYYSTSEIYQSHPTLVLELNHIKFELVPACKTNSIFFTQYNIPAPSTSYEDWIYTSPNNFNDSLISANKRSDNKLKPLIRLIKYWNALNGHIYSSYELEQHLIKNCNPYFNTSIKDYFYSSVTNLPFPHNISDSKKSKIHSFKKSISTIKLYDRLDWNPNIENNIKNVLPPI